MKKLLLFSTSTVHGGSYLDYALPHLQALYPANGKLLFVPFARPSGLSHEAYTHRFREVMEKKGYRVSGAHEVTEPKKILNEVDGIFIGGGNTFLLTKMLYDLGWVEAIREAVEGGIPYAGSSAGSNVAGKNMRTTNDMPIVYPPTFDALGLIPFNINPHYMDPDPNSKHMGETRETRIKEFHTQNMEPVLGLREGNWLSVRGSEATVQGNHPTRLFRKDMQPVELQAGVDVSFLL